MTKRSLEDRINHLHKLIDGYRQENKKVKAKNKTLKLRNKHLETFVEKTRGGFKVWYHYNNSGNMDNDGVCEREPVAQNIATIEDAEQILKIFKKYKTSSYVDYTITSPAEGNDDDLPF